VRLVKKRHAGWVSIEKEGKKGGMLRQRSEPTERCFDYGKMLLTTKKKKKKREGRSPWYTLF